MENLKEIQKIELNILKITTELLNKHKIRWYLIYGSCLGAVRHHGFIPWDDDIDIGLFRTDYEKAKVILAEELPEGYIFCDILTEKEYPYNFSKVRKDKTAFVHPGDSHLHIHHGIYIDIFPLDYCPKSSADFRKIYNKAKKYRQEIDFAYMDYKRGTKLRPVWAIPIIAISHILFEPKKVQEQLNRLISEYPADSGWVCSYLGDYGEGARCQKEWFGNGKWVEFEDLQCCIPEKADLYLKKMYGDYMALPPMEKRITHHDSLLLSTTDNYQVK